MLAKKLESLPSLSSECSIYRVPKRLRKWNNDAYTPQVVSIGPLHHGSNGMQAMEEHKLRYLKDFLFRTGLRLDDYVKFFRMREEKIRNHYEETIKLRSGKFLELMMVDTAFVIEVMLRFKFTHQHNKYDRIFSKPWLIKSIRFDMLLLENQLPFFILEELFVELRRTFPPENAERYSLIELTHHFFQSKANLVGLEQLWGKLRASKIEHFLHFIYICHLPFQLPPKRELKTLTLPSAKLLHLAGVKFKEGSTTNIYDIKFKDGILEIPRLQIRGQTETIFRNLLAFEQYHFQDNYISNYFFVLDRLIDNSDDVELLVRKGIIDSKLPDKKEVATFSNNLVQGIGIVNKNFYFTDLFENLNDYHGVSWHKWKANLIQDYFSNPWSIISVMAASILLILGVIQTVYSILSV